MFTEEEKNVIIDFATRLRIDGWGICPRSSAHPILSCVNICDRIFPRAKVNDSCPCHDYSAKYVKDKFWKAME